MKKIISFILLSCMLLNITTAFAENNVNTTEASNIINTDVLSDENVLYKVIQEKSGFSLFGLDHHDKNETTADFDVVMGFDMSYSMYEYDINGDKKWMDSFKAISEQAPDNTRYSVLSTAEDKFTNDLESKINEVQNKDYESTNNVISMLDESLNRFDNNSSNRNKVVIIATHNVTDSDELAEKLDMLRDYSIIPFVYVLNENTNINLDIEGVYQCITDLDLRLALSDLYLSLAEFRNAETDWAISLESSSIIEYNGNYKSDFRNQKSNYSFSANNAEKSFGMAITSIIGIYRCLPLAAESLNNNYDLLNGSMSSDSAELFTIVKNITTSNMSDVTDNSDINQMLSFWSDLGAELNSNIVSISRNNNNNQYIIGTEAQKRMVNSIKRRFPVLLKIYGNSYIVTEYNKNDNIVDLSVIDYTNSKAKSLKFNISGDKWVLSNESLSLIDDNTSSHEYNTMVFDMYSYINSYATAYNITEEKTIVGKNLRITFDVASTGKTVSGVVEHSNGANPYYSAASFDGNNTLQSDDDILISSIPVKFTAGQPDIYNASKLHYIRVYNDIRASEWYYTYVMKISEQGIMSGYDDSSFRPTWKKGMEEKYGRITRGEFVKTVLYAAGIDETKIDSKIKLDSEIVSEIKDKGVWAIKFLEYGKNLGIIKDCPVLEKNNFDDYKEYQDETITRKEAAYILYKLFIKNINVVEVPTMLYEYADDVNTIRNTMWNSKIFEDQQDIDSIYEKEDKEALRQMYLNSVLDGSQEPQGIYLYPNNKITRGEVSKIITKCLFDLDEDIQIIQATYKDIDGNEAEKIDFINDKATISSNFNSDGEHKYFFVAPHTGYYHVYNVSNANIKVLDMNRREIKNYNDFSGETSVNRNELYNIKKGEAVYIDAYGEPQNNFVFKVEYYDDGSIVLAPDRSGTYIYDNNHEALSQENVVNLTDEEVSGRSWIMSNKNLKPGKYVIFASHNNETVFKNYKDKFLFEETEDSSIKVDPFSIYLDAQITSNNGAKVTLENAGYWVSTGKDLSIREIDKEESWSAIQAYADYTQTPIEQIPIAEHKIDDKDILGKIDYTYMNTYRNKDSVQLSFSDNKCWLSQGIEEMYNDEYIKSAGDSGRLFFVAELTVEGNNDSSIDINIGALKNMGSISDSRLVNGNVSDGKYVDEAQVKGIAYSYPINECELYYEINDSSDYLPINVSNYYNQYTSQNMDKNSFIMYGAPKTDTYGQGNRYVENDMFNYDYDGYNYNIFDGWYVYDNKSYNLGNYGIKNIYKIQINNTSTNDKQFVYEMTTPSNYMVKLTAQTEDGNITIDGPKSRNEIEYKLFDENGNEKGKMNEKEAVNICSTVLPANKVTELVLEIWSPTNVVGSLESRFLIK